MGGWAAGQAAVAAAAVVVVVVVGGIAGRIAGRGVGGVGAVVRGWGRMIEGVVDDGVVGLSYLPYLTYGWWWTTEEWIRC